MDNTRKFRWKATVAYNNGRYPERADAGARYELSFLKEVTAGEALQALLADCVDRQLRLSDRNRHMEYMTVVIWDTTISPPRKVTWAGARYDRKQSMPWSSPNGVYLLKGTNDPVHPEVFRGERPAVDYDEWEKP